MLLSENYKTQLFALKQWSDNDFENYSDLLFLVIQKSVPLVKANAIVKTPFPFKEKSKNEKFLAVFPDLDNYSQSMFLNRVLTERELAEVFIPLILNNPQGFNQKQIMKIKEAEKKFDFTLKQ